MPNLQKTLNKVRLRKRRSVRAKLAGTQLRPRLTVFRSHKNIYCQVIDDSSGRTLCQASTKDKGLRDSCKGLKKTDAAGKVGEALAERAKAAGIEQVCFDRGHYKYHGRVKALADGARKGGLSF